MNFPFLKKLVLELRLIGEADISRIKPLFAQHDGHSVSSDGRVGAEAVQSVELEFIVIALTLESSVQYRKVLWEKAV